MTITEKLHLMDEMAIENKMFAALETARAESEVHSPVFALTDGREVLSTDSWEEKKLHEQNGYWLVSIFEHGYRVEV